MKSDHRLDWRDDYQAQACEVCGCRHEWMQVDETADGRYRWLRFVCGNCGFEPSDPVKDKSPTDRRWWIWN